MVFWKRSCRALQKKRCRTSGGNIICIRYGICPLKGILQPATEKQGQRRHRHWKLLELFKLFGTIAINNGDANKAIDDTTGRAEKSESRMSSAFKKIGAAITTYFAVDKLVSFGKSVVDTTASFEDAC